jgi:hypothetical protein
MERRLRVNGAVLVEGPKACGKTETARRAAASEVLFDVDRTAREALKVDPTLVLDGAAPRLLDEWQLAPELWNYVRRTIDERGAPGQFILTGSAVPADDVSRHTGAGRISRLRMRPMALYESGHSTGAISLAALFDEQPARSAEVSLPVQALAERICAGGWPALRDRPELDARHWVRDYLIEIQRTDIQRVDGTDRDPETVGRVLRSLARNVATEAAATTIAADVAGGDAAPHPETVRDYLHALERIMVVEDQPAWAPHLRSRSILRRSPKRHFVDPSMAAAAVRADPARLLRDLSFLGALFESLAVRDLRVYAQALDGQIYHYRDNTGLEVDAIVTDGGERWGACEIKLGRGYVDEAAKTLLRFRKRVDTKRSGPPAFLAVIVPEGYGYRREDGIDVIPLAALGP